MVRPGRLALPLLWAAAAGAQEFRVYVGQIGPASVLIAWGKTAGAGNTIGRASRSWGKALLRVGDHTVEAAQNNWAEVRGLRPDTVYDYEVAVEGRRIAGGRVRTWPARADRLTFFVIGDFGNGSSKQYQVADAMWKEYQRREAAGDPVRFVLTVGDNIYADVNLGYLTLRSGNEDAHWERKFFRPYASLIARIPFLPTLGNHDGNATENRGDLAVYLDNFFFPGDRPARWYGFSFGGLADFFALDSTGNTASGAPRPVYDPKGEQFRWVSKALPASRGPWKIPYFHHPPYNAGPGHGASLEVLRPFADLFRASGVRVVFNGHEHNFQFSERGEATGNMLFVISGAGGEARRGNVIPNMKRAHIAGWAPQRHFLVVEIQGRTMRITPLSYEMVEVRDAGGKPVAMPLLAVLP